VRDALDGVSDALLDGLGAVVPGSAGVVDEQAVARSSITVTACANRVPLLMRARYQRSTGWTDHREPRLADLGPQARGSTGEPASRRMSVTEVPDLRIDLAPAAEAIGRVGRRLADVLTDVEDTDQPVSGLDWSIAELTSHLAARTGRFAAYLIGTATPQGGVADIAVENQRDLADRRDRALADLVAEVRANVDVFVATTKGRLGSDPFDWYSGIELDVATASGLLLGELVVHGFDAARTLGVEWPIAAQDARTIVRAAARLAPWYVDREQTKDDRTTYRVAVRGGPVFRVRVEDGTASVEPGDGPADCTIHADPATLVLVMYGRVGRFRAGVRGKLAATGRRPWRALRFDRSFLPP
jgi:uncharacterized protein (TIGR03083 family)